MIRKHRFFSDEKNVIVYQSGKVASTALVDAIGNAINIHDLYGNVPCPMAFKIRYPTWTSRTRFYVGRILKRLAIKSRRHIRIINIFRDPVSRNFSMFFQDLPYWYISYIDEGKHSQKVEGDSLIENAFVEKFDHYYSLDWYEIEFKRFTGIGIDNIDFDHRKGYGFVRKGRFEVLFLRYDKMWMPNVVSAIEKFLGSPITIKQRNRGDNKWYRSIYDRFRTNPPIDSAFIRSMLDNVVVRKFFSGEEIEYLKKQYLQQSSIGLGSVENDSL